MVKPPKTMQPEAVNLQKAGRDIQKAFQDDSFHNYMARKIDMQRQQFGLMIPPAPLADDELIPQLESNSETPPPPKKVKRISFAPEVLECDIEAAAAKRKKPKKFGVKGVLKRLKKRHGRFDDDEGSGSTVLQERPSPQVTSCTSSAVPLRSALKASVLARESAPTPVAPSTIGTPSPLLPQALKHRPDLFLTGVVALVNGYTDPDTETLQRLLHKHGGDLERYETSRITHIIAENLSFAKAKMYKQQRKPRPVCKPKWILDCVQSQKLLPIADYIVDEVKDDSTSGTKSISAFFQNDNRGSNCATKPLSLQDPTPGSHTMQSSSKAASTDDAQSCQTVGHDSSRVASESGAVGPHKEVGIDTEELRKPRPTEAMSTTARSPTDQRYINGRARTVGTDPQFLESFFAASRLSFIGSYKQRARPTSKLAPSKDVLTERFVFHVDMDCFFASVVLRKYPEYKDKPVAISHLGDKRGELVNVTADSTSECATCNYPARALGIKKGMFLGQARALCPNLILLPYDFEGYEEVSEAVSAILDRYATENAGPVEQVSCDEAYVEFRLAVVDGASVEHFAAELAESIRLEIFDVTQCTATVGVGKNKLLAKLATDHVKPNKSFVVGDHRDLLRSMNLRDLHGIGYRMGRKLAEEELLTVQDVWDMDSRGEGELCRILGPALGKKIFGFCHGRDERPIQPAARKTIGAECSYGVRFDGPYGVEYMIEGLCKEVEKRMTHVGVTGSKVTLKVKQRKAGAPPPPKFLGHGKCHNLSKSTDTKTGEITRDWARFHEVALALFAEMKVADEDVRGMGVIISNLAFDNSNGNTHGTTNRGIAKWLTRQAKADTTTESRDAATTDEPLVLDEWEDESVVDVSTDDAVGHQDCDDIALPNLSQIHMSQVEALPLDIRQQILSKMASVRSRNPSSAPAPEDGGALSCDSRFRQTDVKRMLRMASVKSGACKVQSEAGNDISVTQLECLPLEMQLQVTNDDVAPVGALSAEKRGARPAANRLVINLYDDEPSPTRRGIPDGQSPCRRSATCAEPVETSTDRIRFYIDNVQPLVEFMNEHADADNEATHHVTQFLCLFVQEQHRLTDVTTLLRNIRNRSDGWSTRAFDGIFEAVDDMVEKTFQVRLDKEWVMQS